MEGKSMNFKYMKYIQEKDGHLLSVFPDQDFVIEDETAGASVWLASLCNREIWILMADNWTRWKNTEHFDPNISRDCHNSYIYYLVDIEMKANWM